MGAAWQLHQRGIPVLLLEGEAQVGGVVQSEIHADGFRLDLGAQTLSTRDPRLLDDLATMGLASGVGLLRADPAEGKGFVVFGGAPTRLPLGLLDFLTTPLLSMRGRATLLSAPFRRSFARFADPSEEESLRAIATRWLGKEVADRMVDPLVSGVLAGDPDRVSASAVFPKLVEAARKHRSLAGALVALRRQRRKQTSGRSPSARGIYSFSDGLGAWPAAVARILGQSRVQTRASVLSVEQTGSIWRVRWERSEPGGVRQIHEAEAAGVILAVPARQAANLVRGLPGGDPASLALRAIPSAPVAVVHLAWPRAQVAHAVRGFGLLAGSAEDRRILSSHWPSGLFRGKAPEGQVLTANFVGGAHNPERVDLDDDALVDLVASELADLLGARGTPSLTRVSRWVPGIPQYTFGHPQRLETVRDLELRNPGLVLVGSWRGGASLRSCWASGRQAANGFALGAPSG
jgi:oxygen-dependent protoporphyrinogen oxidase